MNEREVEIESRLRELAAGSRTPPLPAETAALPWTVQRQRRRFGLLRWAVPSVPASRFGAGLLAAGRLAFTLLFSVGLLFGLGQIRGAPGSGAPAYVPPFSPAPTPATALQTPDPARKVVVLPTSGVVDDVMADFVSGGIQQAIDQGAAAVVVKLDTLGGSQTAMNRIVDALDAKIPTIVWVGPFGSQAMSAGTFITLSSHLAYMAPGTTIGAASPVTASGGDIGSTYGQTEAQKVMEYAVNKIEAIAAKRHPEAVAWAATTVQSAKAYTVDEALSAKAINGIAGSIDDVLAQADGQQVTIGGQSVTVHTAGATQVTIGENPIQTILHTIDDPNIAFILLVLGVICVLVEFFHPTLFVGLAGAVSLLLSFYGSGNLPLNFVGVALVVLGIVMLVLEPSVPSHGLLTIGGLVSFIVGAVAFYGSPPGPYQPAVAIAWPIIAIMSVGAAAFAYLIVRTALELRRQPVWAGRMTVGEAHLEGEEGEVRADLAPLGTVYVCGEEWSARSADGDIPRGAKVRVLSREGLTLVVARAE